MRPHSVDERKRGLAEGRRVCVGNRYMNVIKIYKYADEIVQNTSQAKKKKSVLIHWLVSLWVAPSTQPALE